MCSEEKFHALERRVGSIDDRVIKIETTLETKFTEISNQLQILIDERARWSEWLRHALGKAMKTTGIIVLGACGINQVSKIIQLFVK